MKPVKAFGITLLVILALGLVFVVGVKAGNKGVTTDSIMDTALSKVNVAGIKGNKTTSSDKGSATSASSAASSKQASKRAKANPITKAIVSQALDSYVESSSGEAKEIMESMSEEDKDAVTEIIAGNVSLDSISKMQSYVSDGDTSGLMKYAEENLSEEDMQDLTEIMSKYAK